MDAVALTQFQQLSVMQKAHAKWVASTKQIAQSKVKECRTTLHATWK